MLAHFIRLIRKCYASGTKTLGLAWIVYGVYRLAVTAWLIMFTTTATLMFGSLLTRVPDPYSLMTEFHIVYSVVIVWSGISAVLGIVAGLAMLASPSAPRILIVAAALLALPELALRRDDWRLYDDAHRAARLIAR